MTSSLRSRRRTRPVARPWESWASPANPPEGWVTYMLPDWLAIESIPRSSFYNWRGKTDKKISQFDSKKISKQLDSRALLHLLAVVYVVSAVQGVVHQQVTDHQRHQQYEIPSGAFSELMHFTWITFARKLGWKWNYSTGVMTLISGGDDRFVETVTAAW